MKDRLKSINFWVIIILGLGLVFRLVNFEKSFSFAHDQDLYSWIAKDIIVNHHQRLIGQITSVDGVFIGSFYYYLMAVFYAIFKMNPLSAIIPLTLIGLFNIGSIYWVVKRNFNKRSALIASFIYAVSFGISSFDRWSVPTQPTMTWSIWFIAVILELLKGNLKFLPVYGFLVAFTWQLHIALLPILPLPIIAYFMGNNGLSKLWSKHNIKTVLLAIGIFLIWFAPLGMFEIKSNFSQTKSIIAATQIKYVGPTGFNKLKKVFDASGRELQLKLLQGVEVKAFPYHWVIFTIMFGVLIANNTINKKQGVLFFGWIFLIMLAQFTSKRPVSEYYFSNLVPLYVITTALFLNFVVKTKFLYGLALIYLVINLHWLITQSNLDHSYFYRKQLVDYIKADVVKNNYPCVAVNYISDFGVGVGFRYLFWYEGIKLIKPGVANTPVYNISIPWQTVEKENPAQFGRFGVLLPPKPSSVISKEDCQKIEYEVDPLLGYTE